jgi:hypothetical protein
MARMVITPTFKDMLGNTLVEPILNIKLEGTDTFVVWPEMIEKIIQRIRSGDHKRRFIIEASFNPQAKQYGRG